MQFADIDGVTLHYQVISAPDDKPTIVFSNSLGTDFRIWRDVIIRFVGEASIVMYDKRGHGLSDLGSTSDKPKIDDHVNDLAGLLDHLGISDAIICGLSVGGLIAQALNFLRPDLVKAMVLCDTAAKIGDEEMWNSRIEVIEADGLEAVADANMQRWFSPAFHAERAGELQGYINMFVRQPKQGYLATTRAIRDADLRGAAGQTTVPVICIVGENDGATPPAVVLELAKSIPDARYEMIKQCGHSPCVEQPELLAEIIKAFMVDAKIA
ncbi:MAG: 3-oxoadipate enol-lactonase [Pseudomonadota bacterium]